MVCSLSYASSSRIVSEGKRTESAYPNPCLSLTKSLRQNEACVHLLCSLLQGYGIGYTLWGLVHVLGFLGGWFVPLVIEYYGALKYAVYEDSGVYWMVGPRVVGKCASCIAKQLA